ncbi:MAG: hypothetical protein SCARUB_01326 [Candidatus Scalindua rubra]|uniref:Uncharacterized protein n=1 Tax=Candidatus Scalindua rubra TaxID=1872076 RepID=A0A1E3XD01_9BACT|nr:MAG: hypothetical protein SCARUB_01326 [Candidatus Scalindua rubra]
MTKDTERMYKLQITNSKLQTIYNTKITMTKSHKGVTKCLEFWTLEFGICL